MWVDYQRASHQGTEWYSPVLTDGKYVFALQGRTQDLVDNEFDPDRNVRFLEVSQYGEDGPLVRFSGTFIEPFENSGPAPLAIIHLPPGTPVQFKWSASAAHLGSTIASYRYGWDILDLNNDEYWEIPLTPYDGSCMIGPARAFPFGTHTFALEVRDAGGKRTWTQVNITVRLAESFNGALDILPGRCDNALPIRSKGRLTAVLASTIDFDASTVDVETIRLEGVAPTNAYVADVVAAEAPDFCACLSTEPDGRPDVVLTFEAASVIAALNPSMDGNSSRMVWCQGEMDHPVYGRRWFFNASCLNFVGLPDPGGPCEPARVPSTAARLERPDAGSAP